MPQPLIFILKGFVLGISMVLPGISGGTMAFIMGIYEKLLEEISKFQTQHLKELFLCFSLKAEQIKKTGLFYKKTWDWFFLWPLISGMILSVVFFVVFAGAFIEQYSLEFYSLVFGLVLASLFKPFKEMKKSVRTFSLIGLSFCANFLLFFMAGAFLFVYGEGMSGALLVLLFLPMGFLVSIALIVPGISGSYLLLIFGLYEKTLLALKERDIFVIGFFLIGLILGALSLAKFIQKMMKSYFNESLAIILGFILASLYVIYPLPKDSLNDLLAFDTQKKLFLFCSFGGFSVVMGLGFFTKKS